MTTAQPKRQPAPTADKPGYRTTSLASVVRAALLCTFGVGSVAVLAAALVSGFPAALSAAIGVTMVCLFFSGSALVLAVVTERAPAASLLVALLTYTLKIVLVGVVFLSLQRSGALDGPVNAQWLGGTVIACTLVWVTTQIVFSMRARQLAFDPEEARVR